MMHSAGMQRFHASRIHYEHAITMQNYDKGFTHFFASQKGERYSRERQDNGNMGKRATLWSRELSQNKAICTSDVFWAMLTLGSDNVSLNRKNMVREATEAHRSVLYIR